VVAALAALPRSRVPGLRWSTPDQWHVTLRFFGELGLPEVENASMALAAVAGSWPAPFEVEGGPRTRFLGPGLVVWPVEGLTGVAQAVEQATADIGQPVSERRFLGHVTVARIRQGTDVHQDRQLVHPLSASWTVTSLSLVASELHPDGARYRDVASFSFAQH
jgi:2'-5' RNA ligase